MLDLESSESIVFALLHGQLIEIADLARFPCFKTTWHVGIHHCIYIVQEIPADGSEDQRKQFKFNFSLKNNMHFKKAVKGLHNDNKISKMKMKQ